MSQNNSAPPQLQPGDKVQLGDWVSQDYIDALAPHITPGVTYEVVSTRAYDDEADLAYITGPGLSDSGMPVAVTHLKKV